jgi:hypothetical protein
MGLEGIVAKGGTGPYNPGARPAWLPNCARSKLFTDCHWMMLSDGRACARALAVASH